ncbi:MAG: hypothetical protein LBB58_00840, partial [Cellulomonadaceae bacterium]|nr:hypothetical protein [Cellulomonadaceae bacterium]
MDSQHNDPAASGTAHPEAGKKHRWARPHKAETGHLAPQPVVPQPAMPLGGGPSRTSAYGGAAPLGAPGGSGVGVGAGAGAPGGLAPAARPAAPGGYPGAGGAGGQYAPQFGGMPGGAPQSGVAVGVPAGGAAAYGTAPGAAQGEAPRRPSVARSTISFSGAPVPVGNYPEGEATYAPDSRFAPLSLPDDIASAAEGSATSTAESENEH